jgi:glycosyltransferase involved in cell wall biosynthesis
VGSITGVQAISCSGNLSMSDYLSVAALIPVYKVTEDMFLQALRSMFLQSRSLDQLIVVDDSGVGAYKNLVKIIMKHSGRACELVYVRNPTNLGIVKSLNAGLAACTTDVIARMDADDISLPYRIEVQIEKIANGYDLVGGGIVKFGHGKLIQIRYPVSRLGMFLAFLKSNPFAHPTVMFRKAMIQALGGYNEVAHAEDFDLWLRCLGANVRMTNVQMPVLMYRQHEQQVSVINHAIQLNSALALRRRLPRALFDRWMCSSIGGRNI